MYASSQKKIDILHDHYKDTFSHLVNYRKQRDRLLLLGVTQLGAQPLRSDPDFRGLRSYRRSH